MPKKANITIRAPRIEEMERFYAVYCTGLPGVDEMSHSQFSRWWKQSIENGDLEHLWRVAIHKNSIVGVVINLVNRGLNCGFIWELVVLPEYRGQGIGRMLINESETLLQQNSPEIDTFGIGAKTENAFAIQIYENYGYGIRFLELHLRGPRWQTETDFVLKPVNNSRLEELISLSPDSYWGTRDIESWKKFVKPAHRAVYTQDGVLVGLCLVTIDEDKTQLSEIQFHVKEGYGPAVLDAAMSIVETELVDFWIQDNHQDILDHLYSKGYKRIESEFLLKKDIRNNKSQ